MHSQKPEVTILYGTSAELIKLWPLIAELRLRTFVHLLSTNQQPHELRELETRLGIEGVQHLRSPDKPNLVSKAKVVPWAFAITLKSIWTLWKIRRRAHKRNKQLLVFVHGDTMTCLIGALCGRIARCKVVHIEAGLRSHDWRNPFPEELDRVLTARLAHIHFAPDETAVQNLSRAKGIIVNTHGNTSRDSMMRISQKFDSRGPQGKYTLVSLHRAELLGNKPVLERTITELVSASENCRIVMVLDALTRSTLENLELLDLLQTSKIELHEKMPYPDFIKLVVGAHRVVTDSGGLQEECGFLSIPCLVHRKATERFDGIGSTARLSHWQPGAISEFITLETPGSEEFSARSLKESDSPSNIILASLEDMGLI